MSNNKKGYKSLILQNGQIICHYIIHKHLDTDIDKILVSDTRYQYLCISRIEKIHSEIDLVNYFLSDALKKNSINNNIIYIDIYKATLTTYTAFNYGSILQGIYKCE